MCGVCVGGGGVGMCVGGGGCVCVCVCWQIFDTCEGIESDLKVVGFGSV